MDEHFTIAALQDVLRSMAPQSLPMLVRYETRYLKLRLIYQGDPEAPFPSVVLVGEGEVSE